MEPASTPMLFTEPLRRVEDPVKTKEKEEPAKKSKTAPPSKSDEDVWEIPTFLRKKR